MQKAIAIALAACVPACSGDPVCGPTRATVAGVVDGDTIDLDTGDRIRYLMVDTQELSSSDCFSGEARQFNSDLVLGREVTLRYDVVCRDRFGRLLAYVSAGGVEINARLIERGYACVLSIPPNGDDRLDELTDLERRARDDGRGMWSACMEIACD